MNITVYGASSGQIPEAYINDAQQLGIAIAQSDHTLINGAGRMGLMAAAAEGCMNAGGRAIGIIPEFMILRHWQHTRMTQLIVTKDMHDRKEQMASMSDACIALAGGVGTLEELLEIITWKQLGIYDRPIVILNTKGFYNPLLQQLERAINENFMRPMHNNLWHIAHTPEEAVRLCETIPLWDKNLQKFAAITPQTP